MEGGATFDLAGDCFCCAILPNINKIYHNIVYIRPAISL
jgi:hypothetical protein